MPSTPPCPVTPLRLDERERGEHLPDLVTAIPGPRSQSLVDVLAAVECPGITARRARAGVARGLGEDPIVWEAARGANVWDADGNRFVDLTGAFGVALIGHAHPAVRAAVVEQTARLVHGMGDVYPNTERIALMAALVALTPPGLDQCILTGGGAEAVEVAVKTATLAQQVAGRPDRCGVLAFSGGYHGLSYGALAVSAYKGDFRRPFTAQLNPHVRHLPFGCPLETVEAFVGGVASGGEAIGAVLVEPIQGRGGEVVPPPGWLAGLRELCDRHGLTLIFDEIYSGLGRTGRWWAGDHEGVVPDVLAVGKALGGGLPIGACVARTDVMAAWGASRGEAIHTSTFLGHPLASAAAVATLAALQTLEVPRLAMAFEDATRAFFEPRGLAVRGRGAMLGLELGSPGRAARVTGELLKAGYIALPSGVDGDILALTPPLVLTAPQREAAFHAIATACGRVA
jgi:4-aminobutyrate aminotransferase/(S)-3-amino-2-methylpropionate transaminase